MSSSEFDWPEEMPELGFWRNRIRRDSRACVTGDTLDASDGATWAWVGLEHLGRWSLESGDVLRLAYAALREYYLGEEVRRG